MSRRLMVLVLLAILAGCRAKAPEGKRYPMSGEVKALDPSSKTATIEAGKIGNWMDAMTMEYPVRPDTDFEKLHVGDRIEATVVVTDPGYYVTEVKVLPK